MDSLELLKKHWNKPLESVSFTKEELSLKLHKRSFSFVKLLLLISICEFVFWIAVQFSSLTAGFDLEVDSILTKNLQYFEYLNYVIITIFIWRFYLSFAKIKVYKNVNALIGSILYFRKIVKLYIQYNLSVAFISFISISFYLINYDSKYSPLIHSKFETISDKIILYSLIMIFALILFCLCWFFYKIIYGSILRKLKTNYQNLQKIDN